MVLENYTILNTECFITALQKINDNQKGFLIVEDDKGIVLGTLTDGDIRRAFLNGKKLKDTVEGSYKENFTFVNIEDDFSTVINIFKNKSINFLPILDERRVLKNIITKKNLHALLLQDIQPDLKYDFLKVDDSITDYEIYERPWGFYKTTILNDLFQSKIISVKPGASLSLQEHRKREEHWIVVKGSGKVRLGDSIVSVSPGSYLFIPKGCKHRMTNLSKEDTLIFIEVQLGQYFGEDDIIRFEDDYGRA